MNGTSTEHFHRSRGPRQEDLLSPFLFMVVAKTFGALLSKAYQGGFLEGFEVRPNGLRVSYLRFADDTLIMSRASKEQLKYLKCVVRCFEVVSSMKVNLLKSRLLGVGQVDYLGRSPDCLGCSVGSLSTTYLDLSLGASYKSTTL